jgi:hypothetical protein
MATITLIVMEPGSLWPGRACDQNNVIAVGSEARNLLFRTRRRLDLLRSSGVKVREAVLACGDSSAPGMDELRCELAHELLSALIEGGFGRLILTAADGVTIQQRRGLLALAGALSRRVRGTLITVSVRFGGARRREFGVGDGLDGEILAHALRFLERREAP